MLADMHPILIIKTIPAILLYKNADDQISKE